jgi:acetylornithine/N-succinyldiaminopimelate aminotransferase
MDEVESVSGMGMMIGIKLKTKQAKQVVNEALKEGLMLLTAEDKVRMLPPLNISYEEIDKGLAILEKLI